MTNFISEFWAVIAAALGGVIWLVRLESRAARNSDEIVREAGQRTAALVALEARLEKQRTEDAARAKEARDATNATLAEIRADVKALLRKG